MLKKHCARIIIKPRSTHPELRTVASNIILTCNSCHRGLTEHRITYEAQP